MLSPQTSILIVEDIPAMRKIILHLLKQLGLEQADVAQGGEEALAMLHTKAYDVVLSDWKMPGMDGLALLKAMRDDSALRSIPFIMITGEGNEERVKYAIDAGVNNYIVKPLTVQILQQKLMQTMRVSSELKAANGKWQEL